MGKRLLIRLISIIIYILLVIDVWDADTRGEGIMEIVDRIVLILGYSIFLFLAFVATKSDPKNDK